MTRPRTKFGAVCFDCDSTLTRIEGIDELARRLGVEDEVAPLTTAAMDGTISIAEVYASRLSLVHPDRAALAWLGELYVKELVPGAKEFISWLRWLGKPMYVVSGGLRPAVRHLARTLGIADESVIAVDVCFDTVGAYKGFDTSSGLHLPDGKRRVCNQLASLHGTVAMIGDGITDLAAAGAGAFVIGFGGVVHRQAVACGADAYVTSPDLRAVADVLLTADERQAVREREMILASGTNP